MIKEVFFNLKGKDPFVTKRHFHDDIELIFAVRADGIVIKDNISYSLSSGYLYIIDARKPHIVFPNDVNSYIRHKIVITSDSYFQFMSNIGLEELANKILLSAPVPIMKNPEIEQLFNKIYILSNTNKYEKGFSHAEILKIIHFIYENKNENIIAEDAIIQKILNEITNSNEKISLSSLANKLNYSKYYLCHIFKDKTGTTLSAYIDEKKNSKCITYLINTDKSISYISDICGFSNPSSFIRFFKNKNGMSPTKYRKNYMRL